MKTLFRIGLCVLVAGCLLGPAGCGKKADPNVPMTQVQAEADKMSVDQLKAKAMDYKNAIVAKKAEIEKVAAKMSKIPVTEQMGTEGKALQTDVANLNKTVTALMDRFQVYYNKIKEKGGSVSGLEL